MTPASAAADPFGEIEGTALKRFKLLRVVYLLELLQVEEQQCSICDFNREILYHGSYDRDTNVELFNVCESCGKDLINGSKAILAEAQQTEALSELRKQIGLKLNRAWLLVYPPKDERQQRGLDLIMESMKLLESVQTKGRTAGGEKE